MDEHHEYQCRQFVIPIEVAVLVENKTITIKMAWLLAVIDALYQSKGIGCFASEDWLAARIQVKARQLRKYLAKLTQLGLIVVSWKEGTKYLETAWSRAVELGTKVPKAWHKSAKSLGTKVPIDNKDEYEEMYADRRNGRPVKSAPLLNGDVPPICLQWHDRAHTILRSKKNPAIVMTAISRENGAKYFKELWQRLGENTARIETFLEEYAVKIHRITSPVPSSVRQLCKPEIFNWLERQVLGKSRQVAGTEENVIN